MCLASEEKIMKRTLTTLSVTLSLMGCSHTNLADNGTGSVGVTGNVTAQHEPLGHGKHMLVITATPAFAETDGSIEQRIFIHAQREAARVCPNRFEFVNNPNGTAALAAGFMKRSRSYVVACS